MPRNGLARGKVVSPLVRAHLRRSDHDDSRAQPERRPTGVDHRRRAAIGAVAVAIAVLGAACSSGPDQASTPTSTTTGATTGSGTTNATPAAATGLKTIDRAALQSLADTAVKESLIPGLVIKVHSPQGEFVATVGTTQLGEEQLPDTGTHFRIGSVTKTMTAAQEFCSWPRRASSGSTTRCRSTSPASPTATTSPSCS